MDQSGPGSNGYKEVLYIPQSSKTGASSSDYLVSYPRHLLVVGFYPSAEMQLVYSTIPADYIGEWVDSYSFSRVLAFCEMLIALFRIQ